MCKARNLQIMSSLWLNTHFNNDENQQARICDVKVKIDEASERNSSSYSLEITKLSNSLKKKEPYSKWGQYHKDVSRIDRQYISTVYTGVICTKWRQRLRFRCCPLGTINLVYLLILFRPPGLPAALLWE